MARGKRRRPLFDAPNVIPGQSESDIQTANDVDDRDDVEDFVANRHMQMAKKHGSDESDSDADGHQPETSEYDVLPIHTSDSEENDSDMAVEEDADDAADEEKGDWGGKRRNWYGGDTHEYEIMEDDEREEILRDEEEEAIRLQKKALHRTLPEDYLQDEDSEEDDYGEEEDRKLQTVLTAQDTNVPMPELNLLTEEFQKSFAHVSALKKRSDLDEIDRMKYHLLSLFVANIALYFSLRTDPDSVGVDLRTHPVLSRILQIRSLLRKTKSALRTQPTKDDVVQELDEGKSEDDRKQGEAQRDEDANQTKSDVPMKIAAHEKKHEEKRKKKKRTMNGRNAIVADEERVMSLLQPINSEPIVEDEQDLREKKRRKLNKIVGAMERERKNSDAKRMASADLDLVREDARSANPRRDERDAVVQQNTEVDPTELVDDDEVMKKMLAKREKKEARKARKAAASAPHVYTFNDEVNPDAKRKASTQVVKNRGLTRYRPRVKKTPRTKNRLAYGKALIRRKGAVREYAGAHGGSYSGEASGINMSARKSSKF